MKKIISILFAVTILLGSCSKEKKLNKRLDGEWTVVSFDGVAVVAPEVYTIKFEKEKKGKGKFTFTYTDGTDTDVETGTYDLEKDEKITMTYTAGGTPDVSLITSYSKTDMTITSTDVTPEVTILKKK